MTTVNVGCTESIFQTAESSEQGKEEGRFSAYKEHIQPIKVTT